MDVLQQTLPRDNLLASACLDLFDWIRKENIKDLVKHLVENHRDKIQGLSYMETFRDLLLRYDQTQGYTTNMDPYFLEPEEDVAARRPNVNARGLMEHIAVDPREEEYWNTSDEEDEVEVKIFRGGDLSGNGATQASKPLVDYPSDEEVDENGDTEMPSAASEGKPGAENTQDEDGAAGSSVATVAPPQERISEKRRREEDEEDEMGKLLHNKRRNSSSTTLNAANAAANLRKKKNVAGQRDQSAANTGKKIAISLFPTLKSSAGQDPPPEEDT